MRKKKTPNKPIQKKFKLDYHEGLSTNQVRVILHEYGLNDKEFFKWMFGQTRPIIKCYAEGDGLVDKGGFYEYDLFRWIDWKKGGNPPVWD